MLTQSTAFFLLKEKKRELCRRCRRCQSSHDQLSSAASAQSSYFGFLLVLGGTGDRERERKTQCGFSVSHSIHCQTLAVVVVVVKSGAVHFCQLLIASSKKVKHENKNKKLFLLLCVLSAQCPCSKAVILFPRKVAAVPLVMQIAQNKCSELCKHTLKWCLYFTFSTFFLLLLFQSSVELAPDH